MGASARSRWRRITAGPGIVLVGIVAAVLLGDLAYRLSLPPTAPRAVTVSFVATLLWRGAVNGLVIGLAGVGLSMTYSILNFANFAHGDYITAGAFGGWASTWLVAGLGRADLGGLVLLGAAGTVYASDLGVGVVRTPVAVGVGIVVAAVATVVLALSIDRLVYRPMRDAGGIGLLITSVGVAFALRYLLVFVFGGSVRSVAGTPPAVRPYLIDGRLSIDYHELTLVVAALALMLGVHLLLQRTRLGTAMRAMADNEDLARITGVPAERVIRTTWLVGGGLAGIAGFLFVLEAGTIAWNRGWLLLLLIFAAVIMGGIGSIYGAMAGGIVIGVTDTLALLWLPGGLTKAAAFALMIVVLLYRPEGIFAGRTTA